MSNSVSKKIKSDLKFVYSENSTVSIIFSRNEDLLGVAGEFNNNIKELEKITNTSIYSRGNSIILKNNQKKNEIIKNAISFLYDQYIINGSIEKKDIISSINKFMIDEKNNFKENISYIIKTPKKSVIPRFFWSNSPWPRLPFSSMGFPLLCPAVHMAFPIFEPI